MSENEPIIETGATESRLSRVRKLLERAEMIDRQMDLPGNTSAEKAALVAEMEQLNERAAELIAKYGIDRAMLAASGTVSDAIIDKVVYTARPFADEMQSLLWNVALPMRATGRSIKQWDTQAGPKAKGGVPRGGWKFGLRLFAHASDLERIELLYSSLRNQALAGAARIVNKDETFGQAQKADRVSYLEGFRTAVYTRLTRAEREAREVREAEQIEARDQAMIEGRASDTPGVALVLADRRKAVEIAMDAAYGITVADKVQWAKESEEYRERRAQEIADCKKCKSAKGGRCKAHKVSYGRSRPVYERKGSQFGAGYDDGMKADLGGSKQVGGSRKPIG